MKFIVSSSLLLLLLVSCIQALVHFVPFQPQDTECSVISGFGFGIESDTCAGNADLADIPGSYFGRTWNSTAVMLYTYIDVLWKADCSGNPTSQFVYNFGDCTYDSAEGKYDETDWRYIALNETVLPKIPSNSIYYQVYDKKCKNVESYYYITNGTVIGPNTDIPMLYYCDHNDQPQQYSCYEKHCNTYSLASTCGNGNGLITVSCSP